MKKTPLVPYNLIIAESMEIAQAIANTVKLTNLVEDTEIMGGDTTGYVNANRAIEAYSKEHGQPTVVMLVTLATFTVGNLHARLHGDMNMQYATVNCMQDPEELEKFLLLSNTYGNQGPFMIGALDVPIITRIRK